MLADDRTDCCNPAFAAGTQDSLAKGKDLEGPSACAASGEYRAAIHADQEYETAHSGRTWGFDLGSEVACYLQVGHCSSGGSSGKARMEAAG